MKDSPSYCYMWIMLPSAFHVFFGSGSHSLHLDLLILLGAKAKDIDKVGRDIMLSNTSDLKMSACYRPVLLSGTLELVLAEFAKLPK